MRRNKGGGIMRRKTSIMLLWCLAIMLGTQTTLAQTTPVQKVERTLKKVKNRVVRRTSRTTNDVKHAALSAAKEAQLYTEAALTNMPTPEWNKLRSAYDYPAGDPQVEVF